MAKFSTDRVREFYAETNDTVVPDWPGEIGFYRELAAEATETHIPVLEKPDLQDEKIITCVQCEYGLNVVQVAFLPLGADRNTAVYRIVAHDDTPCFLKLRRGIFDEIIVALPKYLSNQGIRQIIPPLTTKTGQLWANLDAFKVILYPFVEGHNGYGVALSDRQWSDFGFVHHRLGRTNHGSQGA